MSDVYEIAQELLDTREQLEAAEEARRQIPVLEVRVETIPALEAKLKELRAALFAGPLESDTEVREDDVDMKATDYVKTRRGWKHEPAWRRDPAGPVGVAIQNEELVSSEVFGGSRSRPDTTDTPKQPITTIIDATEDEVDSTETMSDGQARYLEQRRKLEMQELSLRKLGMRDEAKGVEIAPAE